MVRNLHTDTNNQLGYYLAGLIEGDGSIILRKGEREKTSPKIVFTFNKIEIPMYERLQKILNTGIIYTEKTGVSRYSITNAEAVIHIINLVNGKFRTSKIQALYKAIDNLNKWRGANLVKLSLDNSSIDSNAWLSGFIDTDGHFSIKLTGIYGSDDSVIRGRVQCVFSINQSELNRVTGESNVPFMTALAKFFQVNLLHKIENASASRGSAKTISFFAQSDRKHFIITTYLSKFPLMSSKHLNYLSFFKALSYLGRQLTREEVLEIRAIKSSMNKSRTEYNWDHLNDFYT
uniref:Homing endonuclease LAGLIDADG domain-containing protein n=1 Tax=Macrophomina phaseolina TaxID=35725 RepID=A0A8A9WEN8_9PEZI|nr:hypothetical protein MFU62_mgp42 [Macrophomina phaseolina]QTT58118.1 hypothetical protein [Macrophomina phaseolina]